MDGRVSDIGHAVQQLLECYRVCTEFGQVSRTVRLVAAVKCAPTFDGFTEGTRARLVFAAAFAERSLMKIIEIRLIVRRTHEVEAARYHAPVVVLISKAEKPKRLRLVEGRR